MYWARGFGLEDMSSCGPHGWCWVGRRWGVMRATEGFKQGCDLPRKEGHQQVQGGSQGDCLSGVGWWGGEDRIEFCGKWSPGLGTFTVVGDWLQDTGGVFPEFCWQICFKMLLWIKWPSNDHFRSQVSVSLGASGRAWVEQPLAESVQEKGLTYEV